MATDHKGHILGAAIVGEHAGEVIQMWSLAISQGLKIKAMTGWIAPYPTLGEINKRVRPTAIMPTPPLVRSSGRAHRLREAVPLRPGFRRGRRRPLVFP